MLGLILVALRAVLTGVDWVATLVGTWFGMLYGTVAFDILHQLGVGREIAVSTALLVGATGFFERQHVRHTAERARQNAERGYAHMEDVLDKLFERLFKESNIEVHHHYHQHGSSYYIVEHPTLGVLQASSERGRPQWAWARPREAEQNKRAFSIGDARRMLEQYVAPPDIQGACVIREAPNGGDQEWREV